MDLAKDLAWQKIFRGRSTNLKTEKSGFFYLHFRYFHPLFYLISRFSSSRSAESASKAISFALSSQNIYKFGNFFSARWIPLHIIYALSNLKDEIRKNGRVLYRISFIFLKNVFDFFFFLIVEKYEISFSVCFTGPALKK